MLAPHPVRELVADIDTTGSASPPFRLQFKLELSQKPLDPKNVEEALAPREQLSRLIEPLKKLLNVGKAFSEVCSCTSEKIFHN
jgi:hypothetical protein